MTTRKGFFSLRATWAIPALVFLTFWLGVSAWQDQHFSFGDALYRSVSLFDIGNNYDQYNGSGPSDWRFQVGRWTGLMAVFSTAFAALAAVLQERVALIVARWVRQEVVIIGGEGIATKAFEMARRARKSVVWIGAAALGSASIRSIALPWPPEDRTKTVLEHAGDADHVLIVEEDDADALVVARAARAAAPTAFITILMRDARLAEDAAATLNEARTRVLSVAAVSARSLTLRHPPFMLAKAMGHRRIHALIIGFGQTGQAIARDLIVNCRTTFLDLPTITVIDPRASELEAIIRLRAPEIDACATFTFIQGRLGSEAMSPGAAELGAVIAQSGDLTAAYVCLSADAETLSAAAMLQSLARAADIGHPEIFVSLRDAKTVAGAGAERRGLDRFTAFGDRNSVLAASEFLFDAPDVAARAFSAAYRASLAPEKRDDPANGSARPWDELDETFRQANRDAVAHIPAKMASAGIDPALWLGVNGLPRLSPTQLLFTTDEACERLAELEHERWNAQRRMDGWIWTDAPRKDENRRRHPSLVAYDDLSEEMKEYDRVYIRETQLTCLADSRAA